MPLGPGDVAVDVGLENFHAANDFGLSLAEMGMSDRLQVVNVVEEDVIEKIDGGLEIAWHGEVDEEERFPVAPFQQGLELFLGQDVRGALVELIMISISRAWSSHSSQRTA